MTGTGLAPGVTQADRVILFDGICRLCGAWARFIVRFDRDRTFRLASVQSEEGQAILAWYGLPTNYYETMLLVEGPRIYTRSAAFIRVMARMRWPWRLLATSWIIPAPIRDWLYDRIALNRYKLFGTVAYCLPREDHAARFLKRSAA